MRKSNKIRPNHVYGAKTLNKKKSYFNNYDVYFNPKPEDTVRIKYATFEEVKFTINKLESLFKRKLRPHARISKIANVLCQRLRIIFEQNKKKSTQKSTQQSTQKSTLKTKDTDIKKRYMLSKRYFEFLKSRTKVKSFKDRKALVFKI